MYNVLCNVCICSIVYNLRSGKDYVCSTNGPQIKLRVSDPNLQPQVCL